MKPREWLLPMMQEYILSRSELRRSVIQTGRIPRRICESCNPIRERQFVDELSGPERKVARDILRHTKKYKITEMRRPYGEAITVLSLRPIRAICPHPNRPGAEVSEWKEKDDHGRTIYTYFIRPYMKAFKRTFLKSFFDVFGGGVTTCSHARGVLSSESERITPLSLRKEQHVYDAAHIVGRKGDKSRKHVTMTLLLACSECHQEMQKRACPDALESVQYMYNNHYCTWERALLLHLIGAAGRQFKMIGAHNRCAIVEPDKVFISFPKKMNEDLINRVLPNAIVVFVSKKDMIPFMRFGVDIISIHDDSIIVYDSGKQIQPDIGEIVKHLVEDLEPYTEIQRGTDHTRYIKALARIGSDLGYVPHTEFSIKGSRIDCVWIDREGKVYAAIEVELSGGIKKDIISTWESEPKLAIILNQTKTDIPIHNLSEYVIMKSLPHPLIAINVNTKTLHYFEGQEVQLTEKLSTGEVDESLITEI